MRKKGQSLNSSWFSCVFRQQRVKKTRQCELWPPVMSLNKCVSTSSTKVLVRRTKLKMKLYIILVTSQQLTRRYGLTDHRLRWRTNTNTNTNVMKRGCLFSLQPMTSRLEWTWWRRILTCRGCGRRHWPVCDLVTVTLSTGLHWFICRHAHHTCGDSSSW